MNNISLPKNTIIQFIKFGVVGLINTLISLFAYTFLVYLGVHPQIGTVVGFLLSVTNAWFMNRFFVFKKDGSDISKNIVSVKFFMVYLFTLLISIGITGVCFSILQTNKYIIPFISLTITVPLNFFLNKFWVFSK